MPENLCAIAKPDEADWQMQPVDYGRQFAAVYDQLFPVDAAAYQAAAFLAALTESAGNKNATFAEFGVGTGRVAVPLARRGARVSGVDASPDLLAKAARNAADAGVDLPLVRGDIRHWTPAQPVAVAYCICATLSMLEQPADQVATLARLAGAVEPSGFVVVETHSPDRVRLLHAEQETITFRTEVDGLSGGLVSTSRLHGDRVRWLLSHEWNDPAPRRAHEFSRLITPAQLTELACGSGLRPVSVHSSWAGAAYDPLSPTYIAVFRNAS